MGKVWVLHRSGHGGEVLGGARAARCGDDGGERERVGTASEDLAGFDILRTRWGIASARSGTSGPMATVRAGFAVSSVGQGRLEG